MRHLLLCALVVVACGDNGKPLLRDDAGAGTPADAAPDGAAGRVTGCLDSPLVPTAPAAQLPCDLVPPGLPL